VLTVICLQHEAWFTAVTRYCQDVLGLSDAAVEKLLERCREDEDATYMYRSSEPPATVCHHHAISCPVDLPLVYDTLHLRAALRSEDRSLFAPILGQKEKVRLTEERSELRGLGGCDPGFGAVTREWKWLSIKAAQQCNTHGLVPPCHHWGLKLTQETKNISTLLIGIESSAPLKQDFFGRTHGPDGSSKEVSAFGKRKWRDYRRAGEEVPADLGGLRANVDEDCFMQLHEVCGMLRLCRPSDGVLHTPEQRSEMELFRALLQDSDAEAGSILEDHLGFHRRGGSTVVFTSSITS